MKALLKKLLKRTQGVRPAHMIVGLGNPGQEYAGTRHNVGFQAVDRLQSVFEAGGEKPQANAMIALGQSGGQPVALVRPMTYMNASGEAVRALARAWKLKPEAILVVYDDVALRTGNIRVRANGSAGGHNGIASIIQALGTNAFARLRVGIGPRPQGDLTPFVLGRFSEKENQALKCAMDLVEQATQLWVQEGVAAAMDQMNERGIKR